MAVKIKLRVDPKPFHTISQTRSSTTCHKEYLELGLSALIFLCSSLLCSMPTRSKRRIRQKPKLWPVQRLISQRHSTRVGGSYFFHRLAAADCFRAFITRSTHVSMYVCTRPLSMFSLLLWHICNRH